MEALGAGITKLTTSRARGGRRSINKIYSLSPAAQQAITKLASAAIHSRASGLTMERQRVNVAVLFDQLTSSIARRPHLPLDHRRWAGYKATLCQISLKDGMLQFARDFDELNSIPRPDHRRTCRT
jgi:hypothetical protein